MPIEKEETTWPLCERDLKTYTWSTTAYLENVVKDRVLDETGCEERLNGWWKVRLRLKSFIKRPM
jgi:hypothetical protein